MDTVMMMRPEDHDVVSPRPSATKMTTIQIPITDIERDHLAIQEQHKEASQLLEVIGTILDGIDDTVNNLENDSNLLPNGPSSQAESF
jgi:hypothetical protein